MLLIKWPQDTAFYMALLKCFSLFNNAVKTKAGFRSSALHFKVFSRLLFWYGQDIYSVFVLFKWRSQKILSPSIYLCIYPVTFL